jgi:RimJ/RimL family protein N-acetyltransferase
VGPQVWAAARAAAAPRVRAGGGAPPPRLPPLGVTNRPGAVASLRAMEDVETERLALRRWDRRAHADGLAAVNADAEVMEFINDGVPLTRIESGFTSDRVAEHWRTYGFGLWAIIEKASDRMIGFAGVCHPLWLPGWERTVEVGWRLHRDVWGRGYATEAGRAALREGFERLELPEIVAFVHPDNHRSLAVAERLAMTLSERIPHPIRHHDLTVHTIAR